MFTLFVLMMDIPGAAGNPKTQVWMDASNSGGLVFCQRGFRFSPQFSSLGVCGGWRNALGGSGTHRAFSIAAIFYGVEHFLHPANVPVVPLPMLMPAWIPAHAVIAYFTGAALVAAGTIMLFRTKNARMAATYLGTLIAGAVSAGVGLGQS